MHVRTHERLHVPAASLRFRITALNLHSNSPPCCCDAELMGERKKTEEGETPGEKVHDRKAKNVTGRHRKLERDPATEDVKAAGRGRRD